MGICESSKSKKDERVGDMIFQKNKEENQEESPQGKEQGESKKEESKGEPKEEYQSKYPLSFFDKAAFDKGRVFMLKKLKGKEDNQTKNTKDNLKSKVELFLTITKAPEEEYSAQLTITEEGQENLPLASFDSQPSNSGQVIFNNSVEMNYLFERNQSLKIVITSKSGQSYVFSEHIGFMVCSKNSVCTLKDNEVELQVKFRAIKSETTVCEFNASVGELVNTEGFNHEGRHLFLVLQNFNDNVSWRGVYKSEETQSKQFESFSLFEDDLYHGDSSRDFQIELYSWEFTGEDRITDYTLVGLTQVNINSIKNQKEVILKNPLNKACPNAKAAVLNIDLSFSEFNNFFSLLKKGLQLNLMVAIDFTMSNLDSLNPGSLHYTEGSEPNQYEKTLRALGSVIADYDHDKKFPLLGFGGIPEGRDDVEHCFPLTYDPNPCVSSIEEMVDVYKSALKRTQLSGPTLFSPIMSNLSGIIQSFPQGTYSVFLIFTDGQINDMTQTIDSLVAMSKQPISVIIVGIGNSDFRGMVQLDGDEEALVDSDGNKISRDLVQFVEYRNYKDDVKKLAEEVLSELPRQVEVFYNSKKGLHGTG